LQGVETFSSPKRFEFELFQKGVFFIISLTWRGENGILYQSADNSRINFKKEARGETEWQMV